MSVTSRIVLALTFFVLLAVLCWRAVAGGSW